MTTCQTTRARTGLRLVDEALFFLSLARVYCLCREGPWATPSPGTKAIRSSSSSSPHTNNKQQTTHDPEKERTHTHTDAHAHEKDFVHCALRILISIEFVCSYFATLHDSMSSSTSRLLINFLNERDGGNVRSFFFSFSLLIQWEKLIGPYLYKNTCTPGSPGSLSFTAVSVLV